MNKNYRFEFWRWNFDCDNFKKKNAAIIINMIKGSRLNFDMVFESYGHIEFDEEDTSHRYPNIIHLDDFNRTKTNCLIYNLNDTYKNPSKYNKCFIYHTAGPQEGNYGYVFYNTETGEMMHKYFISHEFDYLCVKLNESFNTLFREPIYDFYAKKYYSNKKKVAPVDKYRNISIGTITDEKLFWEEREANIEKYF